jgi:hypothetical protein
MAVNMTFAQAAKQAIFAEGAKQAFSFLEDAGFHLVQRAPAVLEYQSAQAYLKIVWSVFSGELNVFIGLQPRKGERDGFSLTDLLAMGGVDAAEARRPFQVYDPGNLRPFLARLAADTQAHAQLALAGDRMFFRRLETYRTAQSQRFWRDMEVGRVRMEAEKAWKQRELGKLIALYSSIEEELSASERAKLAYARQQQAR